MLNASSGKLVVNESVASWLEPFVLREHSDQGDTDTSLSHGSIVEADLRLADKS